ncbi:DUF4815 domain-containing protein [Delftia sp. HK171]|uniref:DUF4815 domain-containing protein n=1 Tax=Delftia sp. HK171 TaxID=1920191 RepID=UPI00115336F6|nr:DUF4815 domain-containing protein [Delftia sp. HK171]TQL73481.1 uncharacterized protein DUF4815 [Delftia sp. HK171]
MSQTKIYDRFDAGKRYDRLQFAADRVLQSAELNELQSMQQHRLRGITDVLFKEGDIVRGCQCITSADTGATTIEAGALYVAGAVRGITPGTLTVATVGTVYVGAYLQTDTVTELQDPELLNPAAGTRGYGEPGALRERVTLVWGAQGDGTAGTFYPVWTIIDGSVMPKEPPPNIDAVTQALARYDRDSAGGTYVVRGLDVIMGEDLATGQQVYTVREGAARVNGHPLELGASRRLVYEAKPDLFFVDSEPHTSAGTAAQRIRFDRQPAVGTPQVRVQARKTVTLTHGGFTGAADPLPDNAVLAVDSVVQAGTTYVQGTDWKLVGGQIDWSPSGAEPVPGSTYQVTYQYMLNATPTAVDSTGFTVEGALKDTLVLVSYHYALRRYDRLVLNSEGQLQWVPGVPAAWSPKVPSAPSGTLALASVYQSWDSNRRVDQDAVRVVPMQTLKAYQDHIQTIYADLAELRLSVDVSGRHSGVKKGLFADPMLDNGLRDAGRSQSAHILGGQLQLPMNAKLHQIGTDITAPQTTPYQPVVVLDQLGRTGSMLVNPYGAFDVLPSAATLTPAVDYWTDVQTQWANPIILRLTPSQARPSETERLLSESTKALEKLRQIDVQFWLDFPVGETLTELIFDGIPVTPQPLTGGTLVATAQGLKGTFRIPAGVPSGTKSVHFTGRAGSHAEAVFTGQGQLLERSVAKITVQLYDPLAQTFTLGTTREICGTRLWFAAAGDKDVQVQLREVTSGVPSRSILAECVLKPAQISADIAAAKPTQAQWAPVLLESGVEYAIVVLTNDATTALAVAELGGWDAARAQWVTSQPYSVGVLLSSSNASTWTPHQTRDMTFELLAAEHTATTRTIELGSIAVQDATDLMVQAGAMLPAADAQLVFAMQLEDGSTLEAAPGQAVQLASRYSGNVAVRAKLSGNTNHAAHLLPGMQLVAGSLQATGDYISPAINAGTNVTLNVVAEAVLPAGSALAVQMQAEGSSAWTNVPYLSTSPQTAGVLELSYRLTGISAERLRVRLILTGSHGARPQVTNLRAIVI